MSNPPGQFDHERLDVYQLELRFIAWTTELLAEIGGNRNARVTEASDHLDRASLSSLFNTAEGNGKRQRPVRAKFFDDARGSATESAACLDALVAKGACRPERIAEGKAMLLRIVSMLSRLVERFEASASKKDSVENHASENVGDG
jgi:four helix bundle protein